MLETIHLSMLLIRQEEKPRRSGASRHVPSFGPISFDDYRGRVMLIYWSKDWSRIGTIFSS